jgi:hypothetical protein
MDVAQVIGVQEPGRAGPADAQGQRCRLCTQARDAGRGRGQFVIVDGAQEQPEPAGDDKPREQVGYDSTEQGREVEAFRGGQNKAADGQRRDAPQALRAASQPTPMHQQNPHNLLHPDRGHDEVEAGQPDRWCAERRAD